MPELPTPGKVNLRFRKEFGQFRSIVFSNFVKINFWYIWMNSAFSWSKTPVCFIDTKESFFIPSKMSGVSIFWNSKEILNLTDHFCGVISELICVNDVNLISRKILVRCHQVTKVVTGPKSVSDQWTWQHQFSRQTVKVNFFKGPWSLRTSWREQMHTKSLDAVSCGLLSSCSMCTVQSKRSTHALLISRMIVLWGQQKASTSN